MIRLLVIDNRDSFVYNIVQLLRELPDISYELRQEETLAEEQLEGYDGLILSPGPGLPGDYPEMLRLVRLALDRGLPLLGVCLGHQALASSTSWSGHCTDMPASSCRSRRILSSGRRPAGVS